MKLRGGSLLLVLAWGARCDVQPVLSWKTILLGGDDIQVTGATTSPDGVLVAGKTYDLDLGDALAPFSIADATTNIAVFDPTTAALSNVRSLPDRNLRNFAFDQSSGLAYFGSSTHIFRYSADGAWKDVAKSIPGVGETGAIIQLLIATGNGVYAATVSTGGAGTKRSYYYSPDAGETWEQGDARIELAEAADPFDSCRLLTATSASQDCGKTWLDQKEANPAVRVAMPDPRVKDLLYAWSIFAEVDGRFRLYRSRDWGKSWESLQTFSAAGSIAPDPADPFGLYMANADGVYQSGDRGTNWSRIGAPPLTNGSARFQLIGDFVSAAMYLNIHDGFGKVYVSRDGMRSFSRIAEQTSPLLAALTGDGRLLIHRDALPVGFVAKFSWDGAPMFFRYLPAGGYMYITGSGIAPTGEIVISGFGYFPRGFPATSELPVVDQNLNDGFVLRISSDGQQLLSSTRTARPFTQAIGGLCERPFSDF